MNNEKHSRVLIVDDMIVNRQILSALLESNGVTSDMASSGKECIELCEKNSYDLILLDHRMPEPDGVDTLMQLKDIFEAQNRSVPVVCHTTEDGRNNINLYKAAGFADVLIKPIEPKRLSEILMRYLPEGTLADEEKKIEEARINEEISKLPEWMKDIDGINLHSAIEHCETAEDYIAALRIFVDSIEKKSAEIERFVIEDNLKMYTLRVHSLKNMSRLVGAELLANISSDLENAGKQGDIDIISKYNHLLLDKYRAFLSVKSFLEKEGAEKNDTIPDTSKNLPEISELKMIDAYSAIKDFVICYDADSIRMVLESLKGYSLSYADREKIDSLSAALSTLEWERLRAIMCI